MKTVLAMILVVAALAASAFYGIPILIDRQTAAMRIHVNDLEARMQQAEMFIRSEEDAAKSLQIGPDADLDGIIGTINNVGAKLAAMEIEIGKKFGATAEEIKAQKVLTDEHFMKQRELLEKALNETREELRESLFNTLIAGIRGNILKAKVDLVAKNIGNAKTELDEVAGLLQKAKNKALPENKTKIEELEASLKKVKSELDTDLPAALNRIELLWHEISGLMAERG